MSFLFIKRYYLFHAFFLGNHCEEAIVRTDEIVILRHEKNRPPYPPYPRIHHGEMDRSLGKIGIGIAQDKGAFPNIVGAYLVGNINKETLGVDIQNRTLHRCDIMVFCAKIGEQSDNRLPHQASMEFGVADIFIINSLIIITTLICKIPPNLPLPAFSREKTPKGGITPLWQRGARGDFLMTMSIQF